MKQGFIYFTELFNMFMFLTVMFNFFFLNTNENEDIHNVYKFLRKKKNKSNASISCTDFDCKTQL